MPATRCKARQTQTSTGFCESEGVPVRLATHWADGGKAAAGLAQTVCDIADDGSAALALSYPDATPLLEKIEIVARDLYGAGAVVAEKRSRKDLAALEAAERITVNGGGEIEGPARCNRLDDEAGEGQEAEAADDENGKPEDQSQLNIPFIFESQAGFWFFSHV